MPLWKTEAIILQSRRWGEADRLVTFYARKLGKVRGVARKARLLRSPFGGGLEPFGHVEVTCFEKGHDPLVRINHVDVRDSFFGLRESLDQMSAAARLLNLVSAISADRDAEPRVFASLLQGLRALEAGHDPTLLTLIIQVHILWYAGFRPQLDHCVGCGKGIEAARFGFSAVAGGIVCLSCDGFRSGRSVPISPGSVAFIQQARRWSFPVATRLQATGTVRREVETVIDAYVHEVVGRALPALDFLTAESTLSGAGFPAGSRAWLDMKTTRRSG